MSTSRSAVFFQPPAVIATTVFTEIPAHLRRERAAGDRGWDTNFLEGPSFDRQGNLWCVDIFCGRIYRISPSGQWELAAEYDGHPNGLKFHRDGSAWIADRKRGIVKLDTSTGRVEDVVAGPGGAARFKGPNDLHFASNGDLFFTDQGDTGLQDATGCVYRLRTGGELDCLQENIPSPNGLALNPRESILFVAATRANAVWRIELAGQGRPLRTGLFAQLPSTGPDGLAVAADGTLLVAHAGAGVVWGFGKWGTPVYAIESCAGGLTTNMAFGGPDGRQLYITDSSRGAILRAELPVAGHVLYSHAN